MIIFRTIFGIFGLFGFMTGPILLALFGSLGLVKIFDLIRGVFGFGGSGAEVEAARGGIFLSTITGITAVASMSKARSKLRRVRRAVVAFGDEVDSAKRDK